MPKVSIIIPCYNEQATIVLLLDALYQQTFPRTEMEVVISDGMSTDDTRNIITAFQQGHPNLQIQIVDNTLRSIPSGLNRAIEHSTGEIIVLTDANTQVDPAAVRKLVRRFDDPEVGAVCGKLRLFTGRTSRRKAAGFKPRRARRARSG